MLVEIVISCLGKRIGTRTDRLREADRQYIPVMRDGPEAECPLKSIALRTCPQDPLDPPLPVRSTVRLAAHDVLCRDSFAKGCAGS